MFKDCIDWPPTVGVRISLFVCDPYDMSRRHETKQAFECLLVGRIYVDLRRVASAACPVDL